MSVLGFTAEHSLYKSTRHYHTSAGLAQAAGMAFEGSFSPISPGGRLPGFPLPSLSRSCTPCYLDPTGACVQDCTTCVPGQIDGCQDSTRPCPPSACCPPGQDPCPTARLCCPAGTCCFDHCCP